MGKLCLRETNLGPLEEIRGPPLRRSVVLVPKLLLSPSKFSGHYRPLVPGCRGRCRQVPPPSWVSRTQARRVRKLAATEAQPPISDRVNAHTSNGQHMKPIELCWMVVFLLVLVAGCQWQDGLYGLHHSNPPPQAALAQNPMYVPLSDREFLWNQLIDTVDDYFEIEREGACGRSVAC